MERKAPELGYLVSLFGGNVGIGVSNPTNILHINGQGRSTNSAWATTSDIRLKDVHGNFKAGLAEILRLPVKRFTYKRDNPYSLPSDKEFIGTIAQEAEKAIPESVSKDSNGYLVLNQDPIFWSVVNAVKQLYQYISGHDQRIASLEAENRKLKEENEAVRERLDRIERSLASKP